MAKKQVSAAAPAPANRPPYMLIEEIRVQGYKSLVDAKITVRPLTLLAGTNSSGKSSIMQPLLLIKQTMEAFYQPAGALVLDGAHVQAETADELVSKAGKKLNYSFSIQTNITGVAEGKERSYHLVVEYALSGLSFKVKKQEFWNEGKKGKSIVLTPFSTSSDILSQGRKLGQARDYVGADSKIKRRNGFLQYDMTNEVGVVTGTMWHSYALELVLAKLAHIPGLRGKPQRSYIPTFFEGDIRGTFDLYAAGTVSQWQEQQDAEKLAKLNDYLRRLGLTDSVTAKVKNANEVELSVSRLPAGSKGKPRKADMVNIADVGIGVSQVLPILVALIAAQEGQIVYVEQPELHLHPRAQVAMAELLAEAANRGVRVIVETHSSLLLLTVQTLIAQSRIKNTDVALHWFARDAKGATQVTYVEPDEDGAYGEWPEDFGDVELKAQDAYLTAVGLRHFGNAAN